MADSVLARLKVVLGLDSSEYEKGVDGVSGKTSKATDSTVNWGNALKLLAGATALGLAANKVFDLGSAVEETASKFSTVFGPAQKDVQGFIDDFASMAGLTTQNAQAILATTGSIVQGMGFSREASAGLAKEVVKLAADFSSFNNLPIEQTSRAVQSALTGEREQLKSLGIVLSEADVQTRALALSGKTAAESLTQQEKATATMALITERAGVAVGDLERTQDSSANTARRVFAEIMNLRDGLAVALMPAINVVVGALGEMMGGGGLQGIVTELQRQGPVIGAWAGFVVATMKTITMAFAAPITVLFNLGQQVGLVGRALGQLANGDMKGVIATSRQITQNWGDMRTALTRVVTSFDGMRVAAGTALSATTTGAKATTAATDQVTTAVTKQAGAIGKAKDAVVSFRSAGVELSNTMLTMGERLGRGEVATNGFRAALASLERDGARLRVETTSLNKAMSTFEGLMESSKTDADKLAEVQARLSTLLQSGAINQEQYNRAMAQAKTDVGGTTTSFDNLSSALKDVIGNFEGLGVKVPEKIKGLVDSITEKWGAIGGILKTPFESIGDWVGGEWLGGLLDNVKDGVGKIASDIASSLGQAAGALNFGEALGSAIGSAIGTALGSIFEIRALKEGFSFLADIILDTTAGLIRADMSTWHPRNAYLAAIMATSAATATGVAALNAKEWSPTIQVQVQGGGSATYTGTSRGGSGGGASTSSSRGLAADLDRAERYSGGLLG